MSPNDYITAAIAFLTTMGTGIGFVLKHLSTQRQLQRDHEEKVLDRQKEHEKDMLARQEALAASFSQTALMISKENHEENRRTTDMLLVIQKETVTALNQFGTEVADLGAALREMRISLDLKADKHGVERSR